MTTQTLEDAFTGRAVYGRRTRLGRCCRSVTAPPPGASDLHDEWVLDLITELAPDTLRLQVLINRFNSVLPPDPARLVTAERRVERQRAIRVDPHRAGLEPLRHPMHASNVMRPDTRSQAELGVVRQRQRFGFVFERGDCEHRTKDFVAHQE